MLTIDPHAILVILATAAAFGLVAGAILYAMLPRG